MRARRSAGGAGFSPSAARRARRKRSTGVRLPTASATLGGSAALELGGAGVEHELALALAGLVTVAAEAVVLQDRLDLLFQPVGRRRIGPVRERRQNEREEQEKDSPGAGSSEWGPEHRHCLGG